MTLYSRSGDDISRGLVFHSKMNDVDSILIDQVKFNDGEIIGATTVKGVGTNARGLLFDGINDWVDFETFEPDNVVCVSFWLNFITNDPGPVVYSGPDVFNSASWDWSFFVNSDNFMISGNTSGGPTIDTVSTILGQWNHYFLVRDDGFGNMLVYKNGVLVVTDSDNNGSGTVGGQGIRIAKAGTNFANFKIQNLRMYNKIKNAGIASKLFRTRQ